MNTKIKTLIELSDGFKSLREKYVPDCGKCEFLGGEIIRAFDRLCYRYYNDGDMVGQGYGNETCNSSYRFLVEVVGKDIIPDLCVWIDSKYVSALVELAERLQEFLSNNSEVFTTRNIYDSRTDYTRPEDYIYDDEDEDEEEFEDELY